MAIFAARLVDAADEIAELFEYAWVETGAWRGVHETPKNAIFGVEPRFHLFEQRNGLRKNMDLRICVHYGLPLWTYDSDWLLRKTKGEEYCCRVHSGLICEL